MAVYTKISEEEEAFKQLYNTYKNRLYGYALAMVHSTDAAEDITQEIFIKLWVSRYELSHINDMEHYLFTVVRNRTLNYIRKAANDTRLLRELQENMISADNNVEKRMAACECEQLIEEALKQLSPQRSLVFKLSRYQHLKLDEIAIRLHLSRNTVKNHLVEALRFIRSYLAKHGVTLLLFVFWLLK